MRPIHVPDDVYSFLKREQLLENETLGATVKRLLGPQMKHEKDYGADLEICPDILMMKGEQDIELDDRPEVELWGDYLKSYN